MVVGIIELSWEYLFSFLIVTMVKESRRVGTVGMQELGTEHVQHFNFNWWKSYRNAFRKVLIACNMRVSILLKGVPR